MFLRLSKKKLQIKGKLYTDMLQFQSFRAFISLKKKGQEASQRQQILFKKQKPLFYFEQSFIFPITSQTMDQPNTDVKQQQHLSHTSLQLQIREAASSNRPQGFPWDLRWLRGDQYKNMLQQKHQYCLQFGFSQFRADQHPIQIYQQPKSKTLLNRDGMIYFVKQKTIKTLGFPRTSEHKRFHWKKLNFITPLPKSSPLVSYVVANCIEKDPLGHPIESHFRMHIVQIFGENENQLLCHIRSMKVEEEDPQKEEQIKGLRKCFDGERPDFYTLFSVLHNYHSLK